MRDLKAYYKKAMDIVTSIGAEPDAPIVGVTTLRANATRAWGGCFRRNFKLGKTQYVIKINQSLLDETKSLNDDALTSTLVHEILHACAWDSGHTGRWLSLANEINRKYGYNIQRVSSSKEKGMSEEYRAEALSKNRTIKIKLVCEKCGYENLYCRESKFTRNYKGCRCGLCHGSLRREDVFTA
ncbi:MAG: SprT-like family protein [Bacteroidetes bacterium ADurb.Bin302]|nr:MAG: SprT-like family protein [Bacteroidetes bacterium ADurb.Bin302]